MGLKLDRMEIEEEGQGDPVRLAAAIHKQLGHLTKAVPMKEIALGLDIHEIREEPLTGCEAALLTQPERDIGAILVNSASDRRRRRFSIGHELGHFLQAEHVLNQPGGFCCSGRDMIETDLNGARYEAEANRFSIELLAPRHMARPFLNGVPDLQKVQALSNRLDISVVAAARRYIELHIAPLAVLVCRGNVIVYIVKGQGFPFLLPGKGDAVSLPDVGLDPITAMESVDPRDWLAKPNGLDLSLQTLHQRNGHSISLLHAGAEVPDDRREGDDE